MERKYNPEKNSERKYNSRKPGRLVTVAAGLVMLVGYSGLGGCNKNGIEKTIENPPRMEQSIPSHSEELVQIYKKIDACKISRAEKEKYKEIYRGIDITSLTEEEKQFIQAIDKEPEEEQGLLYFCLEDKIEERFPWIIVRKGLYDLVDPENTTRDKVFLFRVMREIETDK